MAAAVGVGDSVTRGYNRCKVGCGGETPLDGDLGERERLSIGARASTCVAQIARGDPCWRVLLIDCVGFHSFASWLRACGAAGVRPCWRTGVQGFAPRRVHSYTAAARSKATDT